MAKRSLVSKTNAMRELDRAGIVYSVATYNPDDPALGDEYGVGVAKLLREDPDASFKTLVTRNPKGECVVCCIPVAAKLDLKRAAAASSNKSLAMLPLAELEPTTGYVRGGCTPVGMRKRFPVLIDETAQLFDSIGISGGARGVSLRISPVDLADFVGASFADIALVA